MYRNIYVSLKFINKHVCFFSRAHWHSETHVWRATQSVCVLNVSYKWSDGWMACVILSDCLWSNIVLICCALIVWILYLRNKYLVMGNFITFILLCVSSSVWSRIMCGSGTRVHTHLYFPMYASLLELAIIPNCRSVISHRFSWLWSFPRRF